MTIETQKHGTNEHLEYERRDSGTWYRVDKWTSHETGESTFERRFCDGPKDDSPQFRHFYAGEGNAAYDAKCSLCWLGFSHTLAIHNKRTSAAA